MINKLRNTFLLLVFFAFSCGDAEKGDGRYVLVVEPFSLQETYPEIDIFKPDTVEATSAINAYAKGVQRYAAAWMQLGQAELADTLQGIQITDLAGENMTTRIGQEQRDSVIMDFIKFARRSTIPYYDHVKDFDLKMMKIR